MICSNKPVVAKTFTNEMDMPFLKLIAYFLLPATSFTFAANEVSIPAYFDHNCNMNKSFTSNSTLHVNLNSLFYSLSSKAALSDTAQFYSTMVGSTRTNDAVYGVFMCRGDVPHHVCEECVEDATYRIASMCPYKREAIIWYDQCLVRYSNRSFLSTLDELPRAKSLLQLHSFQWHDPKTPHTLGNFSRVPKKTLNDAVAEAAAAAAAKMRPEGTKKFATKEAKVNSLVTMYTLVQCTPDLSTQLCIKCLHDAMETIPWWCAEVVYDETILTPSCSLRFGLHRFYYKGMEPPFINGLDPFSPEDDPRLVAFNCSNSESFTAIDTYQQNLKRLTHELCISSNITRNKGFYNATILGEHSDTIYGLFMCRGDVSPMLCRECVDEVIKLLDSSCRFSKEAIVWYDVCMVRYSNRSFFSTLDTKPIYTRSCTKIPENEQEDFNRLLANTLNELVAETAKSGPTGAKKFVRKEADNVAKLRKLYTLAQCTPDLSSQDCEMCLQGIQHEIKLCCLGMRGGTVVNPSCNLRFELYRFYYSNSNDNSAVSDPPEYPPTPMFYDSGTTGKDQGQSRTITIVMVLIVVSVMLFCFGCYYWRRKKSNTYKAILKKYFGSESSRLEPLQFSLATIEAATNKFSNGNRIGKGGFGEVYKGILPDGREIAVKRLSKSSRQGLLEFKNEVLLIAKLQHRNLVALLGFCLKNQEKILVYEYVPNKSLDYLLFGSQKAGVLNWAERSKIIGGIAQGILYLHEYSRLKVIHRDLKPNNILLDEEMNPKISDFGTDKMVGINETRGSTNRIVGTLGYMSPEYIKFGLFSEKSDIFSFGVMILEIVSGQKNASSYDKRDESQSAGGLLRYVWKQWKDEKFIEILDSNLTAADSHSEIIKCIQIGLLCVQDNPETRPSTGTIVQYLSNDLIQMPIPQVPSCFIHDQVEPATARAMEAQLANHNQCSINEMSDSTLFPR